MASYSFEIPAGSLDLSVEGTIDVLGDEAEAAHLRVEGSSPLRLTFSRQPRERFVGLGESFVRLEQTGRRWQGGVANLYSANADDTYFYLPFLLSSAGYGVVLVSHAKALWDLGSSSASSWSVEAPEAAVELRLLRGAPKRIVEQMTALFGRSPLAPPWVFGVWKTTLSGTDAVLRHAERLRAERIPVTACWVYDHYDEGTNSGCGFSGTYPSGSYPDLGALTQGLHGLGFRALGYVQPGIYQGSAPYWHALERGYLVKGQDGGPALVPYFNPKTHPGEIYESSERGRAAFVDLTNLDAASWYRGLLEETLAQGWDGWMQDMGEDVPDEAVFSDGASGATSRNRYPLDYHRLAHSVWSAKQGAAVFARSGALGVVPYVSAVWPGDQACDWSLDRGLASVLPSGPSVGLCGVAAFGPDISGVGDGLDGGAGGRDEELWLRWCQYGALNPIMRDHLGFKPGAGTPVDLWTSARTIETFRHYANLHLRLFPYLYGLAREASETGIPIVRALCLEHPEQDEAWWIADEYLLGDALLVAPVHEPGARSRNVWFPPGEWVSWWEGRRYQGPGWAPVPAPLEQIPLFQRAGSTIPLLRETPEQLETLTERDTELRRV